MVLSEIGFTATQKALLSIIPHLISQSFVTSKPSFEGQPFAAFLWLSQCENERERRRVNPSARSDNILWLSFRSLIFSHHDGNVMA